MGNGSDVDAVAKLDEIIRNRGTRQNFHKHPKRTMQDEGGDPNAVPREVWDTVTHMSSAELDAIGELGVALDHSGLLDGHLAWRHVV